MHRTFYGLTAYNRMLMINFPGRQDNVSCDSKLSQTADVQQSTPVQILEKAHIATMIN